MQGMGQDVDLDVAPGEQSPIHPDQPIAIVIRNEVGHARQSPSLVIIVWRNRGAIVCSAASWRAAAARSFGRRLVLGRVARKGTRPAAIPRFGLKQNTIRTNKST